jgi:hypothetical protein
MVKQFSLVLGVVLLAVGIWGAVTGGHDHQLIVFGINATHNGVHILSGALAIVASFMGLKASKLYCILFGAVYGLVTVAGFGGVQQAVTMLNLNMADNLLHLGISAACLGIGLTAKTA